MITFSDWTIASCGPFYCVGNGASYTSSAIGCRLQERPPKAA